MASFKGLLISGALALSSVAGMAFPQAEETPAPTATADEWWRGTSIPLEYYYGTDSAASCKATMIQRSLRESAYLASQYTYSDFNTFTYSSINTCENLPEPTYTGRVTTLCDGASRAIDPSKPQALTYPASCYTTSVTTQEQFSADCKVAWSNCVTIGATYSSRSEAYASSVAAGTTPVHSPIDPWPCYTNDPCDDSVCAILPGDDIKLLYWPVTTESGELCGAHGTTIPPSGPSTVTYEGTVLTSPTVYLSFATIAASRRDVHASQCGGKHTSVLFPIDPASLSSYRGHDDHRRRQTLGEIRSFDYADLNLHKVPIATDNVTIPFVPLDAYTSRQQCKYFPCSVVLDDYVPEIALDAAIRAIDPSWGNCQYTVAADAVPVPLRSVPIQDDTQVTPVAAPTSGAATPQSALVAPTPVPTA